MRKLFTFFIIAVIAVVFIAFQTEMTFKVEPKETDGNYDLNKKNFFTQYQNWKIASANSRIGYKPVPPVDATGTFCVDKNGNFSLIEKKSPKMQILPPPHPMPNAISGYSFAQTSGTYTSISSTGTLIAAGPGIDDQSYVENIGFTFTFNGTAYTQCVVDANGYIDMGATLGGTTYANVIADALNFNLVCAMERDLYANTAGSGLYYQLSGSAPNRVFTVEWLNFGVYSTGTQEYNFQMKFYETTNNVQIVFGPMAPTTAGTVQCGLKGSTNADFNSRTTATNWTATTAGVLNTDACTIPATTNPPLGQTWTWSPPVASNMTYVSSNTNQFYNGVGVQAIAAGATNQVVLQIPILTNGTLNPFTITGFSLGTDGSTNPATDITNAKIYYTGNSSTFATTTLFGSAVAPSGTFSISGSQVLAGGTDYFWLTYDCPGTATYLDLLDAQCNTITGTGTMGTVVPTTIAPAGSRFVDKYCDGQFTTNSLPFGIYLTNVTFAGNSQNSGYDPNANFPYAYSFYQSPVANVSQGTTYSFSASINSSVNQQGISVYVDWNQNGVFTDAGEYYNIGVIPSGGSATITGNILVPIGATLGNTRMRVRDNFSTAPLSSDACTTLTYGEIEDYTINVTAATNMAYSSSTATQTVVSSFCSPQTNLQIIGLQVVTTGALSPINATSFTLNTSGSTNPVTDITNAKLWYTGLSSTFATTTQFGGTYNNPNGSFIINGSQTLAAGTNYFWLTYDVPSTATIGDFFDAQFNSVTVGGTPYVPTTQAPAGNRQLTCSALCGTYSIPSAQFPTIASAITALNTQGISCSVVFNVAAGYTETAANLQLNTTGTASNTITFQKSGSGADPLITAGTGVSTTNDAVIKFNGVNYVTFDGIDIQESAGNVTTTTQMEYGYYFFKPDGTHGNSNNTIKNCVITLNKTNLATMGVYFANLNSLGVSQTVTNTSGANSNNTIQNVSVTNSYTGLNFTGYGDASPYAFYDQNNTITGCTITNIGGGANSAYGTYGYYQNNLAVTNNIINSSGGSNATSILYGIYVGLIYNANLNVTGNTITLTSTVVSASAYAIYFGAGSTGTTNTINCTNNIIQNCNYASLTTGNVNTIYANAGASIINITGNKILGNTYGTAGLSTGTLYHIYQISAGANQINITNNEDSANVMLGTTSYFPYIIYNTGASNAVTISGNRIVGNTQCGTTNASTLYGIYNTTGTFSTNIINNVITGLTFPSTGAVSCYFMYNSSAPPTLNMTGNTITNCTSTGSGTFYCVYNSGAPAVGSTENYTNNTVTNISKTTATGTGSIYGIYHTGSGAGTINMNNNIVNNITSVAATTIYGMYQIGSPANYVNINNNTITTLTTVGGVVYGINNFPASTTQYVETGNVVGGISSTTTIYGMYNSSGLYVTLSNNRIYGLTTTASNAYGMYYSSGTNGYIYNNFISDINSTTLASTLAAAGMYISAGTNIYIYYNTIFMKGTSSATTFGNTCIYNSTTPTVDMRNNVAVNLSTPGTLSGSAICYYRSAASLPTYSTNSNNNCFYAGVPAANKLLYYDVTNSIQTLAAYKTYMAPREQVTVSENPPFINVASTPYDLHINTGIATALESGGQTISSPISITTDWDGNARYPNSGYPVGGFTPVAPDMGADEFGGLNLDNVPPSISYTALGPGGTTNRSFTGVTITDASGVNTASGTKPRCYYKRSTDGNVINDNTNGTDGWKYVEANGTTSPFDFTIDYSKLNGGTGVVAGNIVQYFVIAQDLAGTPNVGWLSVTSFATTPTSVNLAAANAPIGTTYTYAIVSSVFSGSYDVGTGWPYPTLTGAGGLFAAINAGVVGGNITAYIHTDITEPGTNQLNATNETGAGGYFITIQPSDATLKTISGSTATAMIIFNGAKRIVIDGNGGFLDNPNGGKTEQTSSKTRSVNISGKDTPGGTKYLLFRNTFGTTPVFTFQNEARGNTITNCYIESNNTGTASGTIYFTTTTGTSGNDSNTISYCDIRDRSDLAGTPCNAIYSIGTTTTLATYNNYNTITNCNIYNNFYDGAVVQAGVYLTSGNSDWTITNNSFYQTNSRASANANTFCGVYSASTLNNDIVITNNYFGGTAPNGGGLGPMTYSGAGAYGYCGVYLNVGILVASSIQNNTVKNISLTTTAASAATNFFRGVLINSGWANIGNVTGNTIGSGTGNGSILLNPNVTAAITYTLCGFQHFGIGNVSNNTVGSVTIGGPTSTATIGFFGIYWSNTTAGQTYTCNNNLLGSLSTANSIQNTNTASGSNHHGIFFANGAGTTNNITNNTIANWTDFSTSATLTSFIYGMRNSAGAGNYNMTGNNIYNLTINCAQPLASFFLLGLNNTGTGINNISNNNIYSLYANGGATGYYIVGGMLAGGAGTQSGTVSKNKIYDIRFTGTSAGSAPYPLILGINVQATNQYTVSNNMVSLTNGDASFNKTELMPKEHLPYSIINERTNVEPPSEMVYRPGSADGNYTGIVGLTGNNSVQENFDLRNKNMHDVTSKIQNLPQKDNATTNCSVAGIYHTSTSIGVMNYYYNTIYVGGSQPGGSFNSWVFYRSSTAQLSLKDNLFINNRSGGAGNHYVIGNEAATPGTGWTSSTSNYNVFLGVNDATIADWGIGNTQTISQWRTSSGGDMQTWSTNTTVIAPTSLLNNISTGDLSIQTGNSAAWLVSGKGIAISGQNTDYFGNSRVTTVSGGCTDIGANEFAATPPTNPIATESSAPAAGTTSTYTLYGRTIATIDWGTGGTSYPSQMYVNYYSGVNPSGVLGGNYSNSYTTVAPRSGTLSGTTYNITYYFGDNETYTITSPNTNTLLAKYDPSSWEVFQPGTGTYQTQLTYNTSSETFTAKVIGLPGFSSFALTDITSPLPIMIASFSASTASRNITLQWTTSREVNNRGFDVERRMQLDPVANTFNDWTKTGYVEGHGNSNENQNYTFTDAKLVTGKYQYRLKQIDFNGNYEYFGLHNPELVDVSKPGSADLSQNYPNPSNPKSKIDFQIPFDGKVSIKVYDVTGREITTIVNELKTAGYYTAEFDGTNLASGVYFYRLIAESTTGQNFTATKKMVLVK